MVSGTVKTAQGNALSAREPNGAPLFRGHAAAHPIANVLLNKRTVSAARQLGLTSHERNGATHGGSTAGARGFPECHNSPVAYNLVCNPTSNTFAMQAGMLRDMQTLGEAVKELREAQGWNQSELARRASRPGRKVHPQNIQQLEAGAVEHPRYLGALAQAFGMTIDELFAYPRLSVAARKNRPKAAPMRPIHVWENAADLPPDAFVELPRISLRLSGGKGGPDREANERQEVGQAFRADFAARMRWKPTTHYSMICEGHSMEPTILDRAPVVIDTTQKSVKSGQIYALIVDGEPLIKRLDKLPGGRYRVRSDNTLGREFAPYEVHADDVEIIGRAVWTATLL